MSIDVGETFVVLVVFDVVVFWHNVRLEGDDNDNTILMTFGEYLIL